MAPDLESRISFSDFPDDVQLNILSFLRPIDISAFACTCRRFAALCSFSSPSTDLWFSLCDRRWGSNTQIRRWPATPSPRLYKTLNRLESLIGFWSPIASCTPGPSSLTFLEWSPSCIVGSRILPSSVAASYAVRKVPFLWLGLSAAGQTLSYLHHPMSDSDVIPVTTGFTTPIRFSDRLHRRFCINPYTDDSEELHGLEAGLPPDRVLSEIYQYFANRTSPGAEKSSRRKGRKKEWAKGRRRGDGMYLYEVIRHPPTITRSLQGLWKGISEHMNLQFYLVTDDDFEGITGITGISFGRVDGTDQSVRTYINRFNTFPWYVASYTTSLESPFSEEEHAIYSTREHIGSVDCSMDMEIVSRILFIHYVDEGGYWSDEVDGRIWEYEDGTFGFGLLSDNFIIDMKPIDCDGFILDDVQPSH